MANYSKYKIGLTIVSIVVIVFIHLFENGFYRTPTLKKWGKLTWDDFDGMVKPFSSADARISFGINVKYDEEKEKYYSYSFQNNVFSWKRRGVKNNTILLRHEQYHFDIAEYFARKMNEYIKKTQPQEVSDYQLELTKNRELMDRMQKKYDKETDHSRNVEQQKIWENKVDSLLGKNKKTIFKRQWIRMEYDNRAEEIELYISNLNDTVHNQYKYYINDSVASRYSVYYDLQISDFEKNNVYNGKIKYITPHGLPNHNKTRRVTTTFSFLEKTIDSTFYTDIEMDNTNEIIFKYQNIENMALSGWIRQLVLIDTIIDNREMVRMVEYETLVDNFNKTPSFYLIAADYLKTRKFSLKNYTTNEEKE